MIGFRAITEENFDDIIKMKRSPDEGYVASNLYSLAQAWLYRDNNDVYPFAVYEDELPVGFMLLDEDLEEHTLVLWRIMFPDEHQHKGYGTGAVRLLIRLAAESGKYDRLLLNCKPSNTAAWHVYEKLGFRPTGRAFGNGETEMQLILHKEDDKK